MFAARASIESKQLPLSKEARNQAEGCLRIGRDLRKAVQVRLLLPCEDGNVMPEMSSSKKAKRVSAGEAILHVINRSGVHLHALLYQTSVQGQSRTEHFIAPSSETLLYLGAGRICNSVLTVLLSTAPLRRRSAAHCKPGKRIFHQQIKFRFYVRRSLQNQPHP